MRRLILLFIIIPLTALGQSARRVEVDCLALFPFEPLTDRYVQGSLSQVAEYVKQWRKFDSIDLSISYKPMLGYKIYEKLSDSTLSQRVLRFFAPCRLIDSTTQAIDFSNLPHSPEYLDYFDSDIQSIKRFFATPIVLLSDTLNIDDCYFGPSKFASLFHRFQMESTGADVSLFAPPAERGLLKKDIFIKDICKLFKFDNELVVLELTGTEIKAYLQKIYAGRYYKIKDANSDLVRSRTPYFMHISAAGLSYRINLTKGVIEDFSLDMNKTYRVATNSFLAKEFMPTKRMGDYRLLLLKWLWQQQNIVPEVIENWTLSPERWVKVISEREADNQLKLNKLQY